MPGETVIFGDSQAQMLYPRYEDATASVMFVTNAGCPPFPNVERSSRRDCRAWRQRAVDFIASADVGTVVYVGLWHAILNFGGQKADTCLDSESGCLPIDRPARIEALFAGLTSEVQAFRRAGKRVVVVLPLPIPAVDVPHEIIKSEFNGSMARFNANQPSIAQEVVRSHLSVLAQVGAIVLDPRSIMCSNPESCSPVDASGRSLYKDDNHLRPSAIKSMFPLVDPFIIPTDPANARER